MRRERSHSNPLNLREVKMTTEQISIVVPAVHLNGTSANELMELRKTAYAALDHALAALREMAPNGRDYYLERDKMQKAVAQHRRRADTLVGLMEELQDEMRSIQEQMEG